MIPPPERVLAAHSFVARRFRLSEPLNTEAVAAALSEARRLAQARERDEPAALFYALARRPRALRGAWRVLPRLLAVNQARDLGLCLNVADEDLSSLRLGIVTRTATFEHVRQWFAERLVLPER